MKRIRSVFLFIVLCTFIITVTFPAFSEGIDLDTLLNGEVSIPVNVGFYAPQYRSLAQFSPERLRMLNRLISHFGLDICLDGSLSETTLSIDEDPLYSIKEYNSGNVAESIYSFEPDAVYKHKSVSSNASFPSFLESQFFLVNRMLDDLYPLFQKITYAFPDYSKSSPEKMNYKEFGMAIRKTTIKFPADFVRDRFPETLSDLADTEACRIFIGQFLYSGTQKIVLYFDENDRLLRINYDGILGISKDSLRKISLSWRCLRNESHKKDDVALKTPTVNGYDRYNLTYVRDLDKTDPSHSALSWDFQLDLKEKEEKKKIRYNADMTLSDNLLAGTLLFSEKQNGQEIKLSIIPDVRKENEREYSGTLEITDNSGKIEQSSVSFILYLSACEALSWPGTVTATVTDITETAKNLSMEDLRSAMNRILLRKLLTLPVKDLEFLNQDIPTDVWEDIMRLIY